MSNGHVQRTTRAKIERLRVRILQSGIVDPEVRSILYGILDLLADKL